jgi:uncharacterized protein YceK
MARLSNLGLLALAGVCASGCGTVLDTVVRAPGHEGARVYGGVQMDAQAGRECFKESLSSFEKLGYDPEIPKPFMFFAGLCSIADIPLSAVADTLALPFTLATAKPGKPAPSNSAAVPPVAAPCQPADDESQ